MLTVNTIGQIIGLFISVVSIGLLVNTDTYEHMVKEFTKSPALCYLGGVLALFVGLFILISHNKWDTNWTTIITIIGWLSVVKGALLIACLNAFLNFFSWISKSGVSMRYIGIIYLLLGLFLTVKGFNLI